MPRSGGSTSASIRSSVLLPEPFGPTSARRSPRSSVSARPSNTVCAPYRLTTFWSATTSRCDGLAGGNRSAIPRDSTRGASTRSTFASAFSRLLTCVALVAFARNRSMNPCWRFNSRCWRS